MSEELSDILTRVETGDNILSKLEMIVAQLLEEDPEKLIHALYRIDVDEKKFTVALQNHIGDAAKDLAQLLYNRVLEKLENKTKFSGSENSSSEEKW
jgi:GGDEF domain-containing protein